MENGFPEGTQDQYITSPSGEYLGGGGGCKFVVFPKLVSIIHVRLVMINLLDIFTIMLINFHSIVFKCIL